MTSHPKGTTLRALTPLVPDGRTTENEEDPKEGRDNKVQQHSNLPLPKHSSIKPLSQRKQSTISSNNNSNIEEEPLKRNNPYRNDAPTPMRNLPKLSTRNSNLKTKSLQNKITNFFTPLKPSKPLPPPKLRNKHHPPPSSSSKDPDEVLRNHPPGTHEISNLFTPGSIASPPTSQRVTNGPSRF